MRCPHRRAGSRGWPLWQFATGLSNVVLDWPLVAAVAHTGGAAALVVVLTWALGASRTAGAVAPVTRTSFFKASRMTAAASPASTPSVIRQFNALTKPRVIQLIVFCALIGMVLAVPGVPSWADVLRMAAGQCRHLVGGRRGGRLQLPGRAGHRRQA